MKDTNLIDASAKASRSNGKRSIAVEVTTPVASTKLASEFAVKFSPETELWLVRGKTGQVRLADKTVIAVCLLNKAKQFPRVDARDVLKGYRKTWRKLDAETKAKWMDKAQAVFSPARKEYHAVVKPLAQSAVADNRFHLERFAVQCTKGGIVHVGSRATYRPEVK